MARNWTIGNAPDCEVVVQLPTVSGHHCILTLENDGYSLTDLGSTNGTYVNGIKILGSVRISRTDVVTLGASVPFPWPPECGPAKTVTAFAGPSSANAGPALTFCGLSMVVGRNADCDQVLDFPMVSGRHARFLRTGNDVLVEDLGSANGTYVNGERINRPTLVRPGDQIALGSLLVALNAGPPPPTAVAIPPVPSPAAPNPALVAHDSRRVANASALAGSGKPAPEIAHRVVLLAILVLQAPVLALLIVTVVGRVPSEPSTSERWASAARTIAVTASWLNLAALWFGLSNVVSLGAFSHARSVGAKQDWELTSFAKRLALLAILSVFQCLVAWVIVSNASGLRGSLPSAVFFLVVEAAVGLLLGLSIVLLSPRPALAWTVVPPLMLTLWLLGGHAWPLPRMAPPARLVASLLPSRWGFEGLLLLESERRTLAPPITDAETGQTQPTTEGLSAQRGPDIAEDFFPVETYRMGVTADTIALSAILLGLAGSCAFISMERRLGL